MTLKTTLSTVALFLSMGAALAQKSEKPKPAPAIKSIKYDTSAVALSIKTTDGVQFLIDTTKKAANEIHASFMKDKQGFSALRYGKLIYQQAKFNKDSVVKTYPAIMGYHDLYLSKKPNKYENK